MATLERKLISCVGYARRNAKKLGLIDVQGHLDQALSLLAELEHRTTAVTQQKRQLCLDEMIPAAKQEHLTRKSNAECQTSEQVLTSSECFGFLDHVQQRLEAVFERRVEQHCSDMLKELDMKMKEQAEQATLIQQLQDNLRRMEEAFSPEKLLSSHPTLEDSIRKPCADQSGHHPMFSGVSFLTSVDLRPLRCTSLAHCESFRPCVQSTGDPEADNGCR
eukprot:Skav233541  [mRNA]  locus=scaffold1523:141879:142538:- [translate_table: standard]